MPKSAPPSTMSGYLVDEIRAGILDGRFPLGSRLNQEHLAETFGVSIIPLRESLRRLQAEGLVTLVPRRGAFVADLSSKDLQEIYQIRAVLEGLAITSAIPNLGDDVLAAARKVDSALRKVATRNDSRDWEVLNRKWHFTLYAASDSVLLIETINSLWDRCSLYRHLYVRGAGHREASLDDHARILELCRAGDAEGASEMLQSHIRRAEREVLSSLATLEQSGELELRDLADAEAGRTAGRRR